MALWVHRFWSSRNSRYFARCRWLSRQNNPWSFCRGVWRSLWFVKRIRDTTSAENEDIDFNLKGHSVSGTKHEVTVARDTGCVVDMVTIQKELEVD